MPETSFVKTRACYYRSKQMPGAGLMPDNLAQGGQLYCNCRVYWLGVNMASKLAAAFCECMEAVCSMVILATADALARICTS